MDLTKLRRALRDATDALRELDYTKPLLGHYRIDDQTKIIDVAPTARGVVTLQLIRKPCMGGEVWDLTPAEASKLAEGLVAAAVITRCPDGRLPT